MGDWSILTYGMVAFVGVVAFLRLVANEIHAKCMSIEQRRERIDLEHLAKQRRPQQPAAAEPFAAQPVGGDDSHSNNAPSD